MNVFSLQQINASVAQIVTSLFNVSSFRNGIFFQHTDCDGSGGVGQCVCQRGVDGHDNGCKHVCDFHVKFGNVGTQLRFGQRNSFRFQRSLQPSLRDVRHPIYLTVPRFVCFGWNACFRGWLSLHDPIVHQFNIRRGQLMVQHI